MRGLPFLLELNDRVESLDMVLLRGMAEIDGKSANLDDVALVLVRALAARGKV